MVFQICWLVVRAPNHQSTNLKYLDMIHAMGLKHQMHWSDCADVQAGLHFCCLHASKSKKQIRWGPYDIGSWRHCNLTQLEYLRNEFNFWNVHGVSGKLPEVFMVPWTFQKLNLLLLFSFYYEYLKYKKNIFNLGIKTVVNWSLEVF